MYTMPHSRTHAQRACPSPLAQLLDLFLIELTNWRWSWQPMVILGAATPLLSILALGVFARDSGREALAYILTGNVVISLMLGNMRAVENHFSFMRFRGTLDYFAMLPIRRSIVILAVMLAFLLLHLPSVAVTILFGSLLLKVPVKPHPIVLLVVPMCAIPLSGIGALIGTRARTPQESGTLSLLVTMAMAALGPVAVPPDRLPEISVALGRFSPATYAASALRQALIGPLSGQIVVDLAVLAGTSTAVLWLVGRKIDWRQS